MITKKLVLIPVLALLATGCTTITPPPQYRDIEPSLVGKPISERIGESERNINDQLALLNQLNSSGPIGSYDVVTHNNNLDARVGSLNTIPQAYAHGLSRPIDTNISGSNTTVAQAMPLAINDDGLPVGTLRQVSGESLPVSALKNDSATSIQKVKKIEWSNNSLNKLADNLAKALGYELVIKGSSIGDKNIDFVAQDQTLLEVVNKLKKESSSFADIVLIEQNKTFNIFYK